MSVRQDKASSTRFRHAELFDVMAKELHVNLDSAAQRDNGEAIARARARCRDCKATEECEGWLDASFGLPLPSVFCPNAPFFHLCIADVDDKAAKSE